MKKARFSVIAVILFMFTFSILSPNISSFGGYGYSPHSPIMILTNSDFTSENGVVGGNGSESYPYLIMGWEIVGGNDGIKIANTNVHFIVGNNKIMNSSWSGISVDFVGSGTCKITKNIVRFTEGDGIIVTGSNHTVISHNDVQFSKSAGIVLRASHWNRVFHNNACHNNWRPYGATAGIYVDGSCHNLVFGNRADENSKLFAPGIWLIRGSNSNLIMSNEGSGNLVGIQLDWFCNENLVRNNRLVRNVHGITVLSNSEGNQVSNNLVISNDQTGILMFNSSATSVKRNIVFANSVGIEAELSDSNNIFNNVVMSNRAYGIAVISNSDNNSIHRNISLKNGGYDLYWDLTGQYNFWKTNIFRSRNW